MEELPEVVLLHFRKDCGKQFQLHSSWIQKSPKLEEPWLVFAPQVIVICLEVTMTTCFLFTGFRVWYRCYWYLVAMGQASLCGSLDDTHIRGNDLLTPRHWRDCYSDRVYWMLWCMAGKQVLPYDREYYCCHAFNSCL